MWQGGVAGHVCRLGRQRAPARSKLSATPFLGSGHPEDMATRPRPTALGAEALG